MTFPWGAGEYDRLLIKIDSASNVDVYITETMSYFSNEIDEYMLQEGEFVSVKYPQVAFITVVAKNEFRGSFKIAYSYEDILPSNMPSVSMNEEAFTGVQEADESDFLHSTEFFVIILTVSVVISILILICFIIRSYMKHKTNRVVIINENKDQTANPNPFDWNDRRS